MGRSIRRCLRRTTRADSTSAQPPPVPNTGGEHREPEDADTLVLQSVAQASSTSWSPVAWTRAGMGARLQLVLGASLALLIGSVLALSDDNTAAYKFALATILGATLSGHFLRGRRALLLVASGASLALLLFHQRWLLVLASLLAAGVLLWARAFSPADLGDCWSPSQPRSR
jgi:hypothetical protein